MMATSFAVGGAYNVMSQLAKSLLKSHLSFLIVCCVYPSGLQTILLEALGSLKEPSDNQKCTLHSFVFPLR